MIFYSICLAYEKRKFSSFEKMDLNKFSSTYFALAIIILGAIGNLLGLIVISRKKLAKIGPQITYIALFIFDCINFVTVFSPYAQFAFNIEITVISTLVCKSIFYVVFAFGPISPMLNVYISIERYISIAFPTKKYFLQKKQIQLAYIIVLACFNLALYVPTGIYLDLTNDYNKTVCAFVNAYWQVTNGYIDLTNHVILPSVLMIIFTILIICSIFTSRSRTLSRKSRSRTLRRDIRFSIITNYLTK